MPSSRRRHRRHGDERFNGPIDVLIYMLSACSLEWDDEGQCGGKRWDSDEETEVTELSSRSSERRGKRLSSRTPRSTSKPRSSSKSRSSSRKKLPRSRSHSVRSSQRSRSLERPYGEERRSRSLSRSAQKAPPPYQTPISEPPALLPTLDLAKNAEIRVYHQDDDVSAISAGTLEMMEKAQILENANKNLYRRQIPSRAPVVPLEAYRPVFQDKENIVNFASPSSRSQGSHFASHASSEGTSEFESVWDTARPKNPKQYYRESHNYSTPSASRGDSYHLSTSRRKTRSHRAVFETPRTRKMRRQIQRDGIGTIAEAQGMYSDEEEI